MHLTFLIFASLACLGSTAVLDIRQWGSGTREYFEGVDQEAREHRALKTMATSACTDVQVAETSMPTAPVPLPPPTAGLTVYHVAVGRGTQNYTCAPNNPTATPTAIGAKAQLYNTTCHSAVSPRTFALLPRAALEHPAPENKQPLFPSLANLIGNHYFSDLTTATFNLHTAAANYGIMFSKKVNSTAAPVDPTPLGPGQTKPVPWLKLEVHPPVPPFVLESADVNNVKEIYRVNTQGGSAPATCSDYPHGGNIEVDYTAEYWFWH